MEKIVRFQCYRPKKNDSNNPTKKITEVVGWVGKEGASFFLVKLWSLLETFWIWSKTFGFGQKPLGFGHKPQDVAMWLGVTRSLRAGSFSFFVSIISEFGPGKTWCFVKCLMGLNMNFVCCVFFERLWFIGGVSRCDLFPYELGRFSLEPQKFSKNHRVVFV